MLRTTDGRTDGLDGWCGRRYLDVATTVGVRYQLAIYMVGSAGDLSIQTTRIMDLQTLDPIAKVRASVASIAC
eukprot:COSAG05_NODE_2736_length_2708_cov_1.692603_2_plen_73_part_00